MLVRRLPYRTHLGFEHQLRDVQRLMNAFVSSSPAIDRSDTDATEDVGVAFNPPVDVYRKNGNLVVDFELPGVDIDNDVDIEIDDGVLTVTGQRSSEFSEDRDGSYLRERRVGRFSRRLSLPDGVDPEAVEADYTNGVLQVCVPLPEGADNEGPRKIGIVRGEDSTETKKVETGSKTTSKTPKSEKQTSKKPKSEKTKSKKSKSEKPKSKKS